MLSARVDLAGLTVMVDRAEAFFNINPLTFLMAYGLFSNWQSNFVATFPLSPTDGPKGLSDVIAPPRFVMYAISRLGQHHPKQSFRRGSCL